MALLAVEGVDISECGESFGLRRSNHGTSSIYYYTFRLWAVPVLAAKLSNQGEMYGLRPLQHESFALFVACIRVVFECQRWERDEVVAQQ